MFNKLNFVVTLANVFLLSSIDASPSYLLTPNEDYLFNNNGEMWETSKYPEQQIQNLINQKPGYQSYFGQVFESEESRVNQYENLCYSRTSTFSPKVATLNKKVYIVNTKEAEQLITIEVCNSANKACNKLKNSPLEEQSVCQQLYSKIRLFYIDDNKELKSGMFSFPSKCVCALKRN